MKRGAEDSQDDGEGRPGKRFKPPPRGRYAFKVLCPESLCACILGSSGATVNDMQERTGVHFKLSQRREYYPGTWQRVLVLSAASPDSLHSALEEVLDKIVECSSDERTAEDEMGDLVGNEPGEHKIRFLITRTAAGTAIGEKGQHIKQLRKDTECKIFIENEVHDYHRALSVVSERHRMMDAISKFVELVSNEVDEPWFPSWAEQLTFEAGAISWPSQHKRDQDTGWDHGSDDWQSGAARGDSSSGRSGRADRSGGTRWQEHVPRKNVGGSDDVRWFEDICRGVPGECFTPDYNIRCVVPADRCGALIGRKGHKIDEVQRTTHTQIELSKPDYEGQREVSIVGPLLGVYAAHMLLMRAYNDEEAKGAADEEAKNKISDLQRQLEELKREVGGGTNNSQLGTSSTSRRRKGGR